MDEIWKPIPRCKNYYASSLGRIRGSSGKILKPYFRLSSGYHYVGLYEDGKPTNRKISRLVCRSFLGESKLMALHKNGIKADNRLENLYYGTAKDNSRDALRLKELSIGERRPASKLTEKKVDKIRSEYVFGKIGYGTLAKKYGVSPTIVRDVISRKTWKHVGMAGVRWENLHAKQSVHIILRKKLRLYRCQGLMFMSALIVKTGIQHHLAEQIKIKNAMNNIREENDPN